MLNAVSHWKGLNTMQSFKFSCPDCDTHIEAEPSSVGCLVACPKCSEELVIPAYHPSAMSIPVAKRSKHFPGHEHAEATAPSDEPQVPTSSAVVAVDATQEDIPAVPEHEGKVAHVGVLTPAVKLDVVRWAFRRIENPAALRWLRSSAAV